jgi:hypothetical protein
MAEEKREKCVTSGEGKEGEGEEKGGGEKRREEGQRSHAGTGD